MACMSTLAAFVASLTSPRNVELRRRKRSVLAGLALTVGSMANAGAETFTGAVYAGSNRSTGNSIAAFGRNLNGTLTPIAEFATGGFGGVFDAGEGLDPLISEDSVLNIGNRFLLTVNAGSNTISSFRINPGFSLTLINTASTGGTGPNSIAHRNGLVYVSNIDSDGVATGAPDHSGNITGLRLDPTTGQLTPIAGSTRELGSRPSDVEFSPDGAHLVISSVNAGSSLLTSGSDAQISTYGVQADGSLTASASGVAASTLPGNAAGRNLPTSIGFEIVEINGAQFVIATEAREFLPTGEPGMLPDFQTGSVSTWRLNSDGSLTAISQDILTGPSVAEGPTSACWIVMSADARTFWVASASGAAISTYRLNDDGTIALLDGLAATGSPALPGAPDPLADADGFIDLALSSDGEYLYQLLGLQGAVNVYNVGADGSSLTLLQQAIGLLPDANIQGIVAVAPVPLPAGFVLLLTGVAGLVVTRWKRNSCA